MKILLMRPPARLIEGAARPSAGLPLGILSIAALLEQNGHAVDIYDALINPSRPMTPSADGSTHVGVAWDEIRGEIVRRAPDIIGITCQFTAQDPAALTLASIAKSADSQLRIVAGGNSPTVNPGVFLGSGAVDIVCRGEGEQTMLAIVQSFSRNEACTDIPGTAVLMNGSVHLNPPRAYMYDLDILPLPAYHLIDMERYFSMNRAGFAGRPAYRYPGSERAVSLITSRGCPFDCIFCSIHLHMGKKWRANSAGYVSKHIDYLARRYGIRHIHFEDDNLTLDMDRFSRILDGLSSKGLSWDTPNGIRADRMTKELVQKCRDCGCTYLILGIESGSRRVLSQIVNKNLDLDTAKDVARWCSESRLDLGAFFVVGFPGETINEMRETTDFALQLMRSFDVTPSIFTATPLIGTRLYEVCLQKGYLRHRPTSERLAVATDSGGNNALIETGDFNGNDIVAVMQSFHRRYKRIFVSNLMRFLLKNPGVIVPFAAQLFEQTALRGPKEASLELAGFKHCVIRRRPFGALP